MYKKSSINIIISSIVIFLLMPVEVLSQSLIIKEVPKENISIDLRYIHPFYKSPNELNFLSGTYDFNVSIPFNKKWSVNTLIPIAIFKNTIDAQFYGSHTYNESALGNIYLGLQTIDSTSSRIGRNFSVGAFLPTASRNNVNAANLFGMLTNYYELQKYLPETVSLYANIANRWYFEDALILGIDIGPQYLVHISDDYNGGNDFFVHYGLSGGVYFDDFTFKSEFTGILYLTGSIDDFADRFMNFVSVGLSYNKFIVKPTVFFQYNIHEMYSDISVGSLGFRLSFVVE